MIYFVSIQGDKSRYSSKKSEKFVIGIPSKSNITSGVVNMAMVAFWEKTLSNDDITLIYKTGKADEIIEAAVATLFTAVATPFTDVATPFTDVATPFTDVATPFTAEPPPLLV